MSEQGDSSNPENDRGIIDLTPNNQDTLSPVKDGIADLTGTAERAEVTRKAQEELFNADSGDVAKQERSAQAQEELKQNLEELAVTDPLTELPNRRGLDIAIDQMLHKASRSEKPKGAYLIIDLDDFKAKNEALGHSGADKVLKDFALKVRALIRPGDIVGRLAGDEFVIWAEEADLEDAIVVADRVQKGVAELFKDDPTDQRFSIGIKALPEGVSPTDLQNPEYRKSLMGELYSQADQAHYEGAKNAGKNKIGVMLDSREIKTATVTTTPDKGTTIGFADPVRI